MFKLSRTPHIESGSCCTKESPDLLAYTEAFTCTKAHTKERGHECVCKCAYVNTTSLNLHESLKAVYMYGKRERKFR